jgi:hypothetical protein
MKHIKIIVLILLFAFVNTLVGQTVYTTKTGEKYHKGTCRYLKYSKKELTIDKAITLGYSACSVCKPTKDNTKASSNTESNTITPKTQSKSPSRKATAKQCTGKTQARKRCKRKTKNASGRCYQHQ